MRLHNLHILGTSHIAKQSLNEVKKAFEEPPDIITLELDKQRFIALVKGKERGASWRDIKHIGFKGFAFALLGEWAERKLGDQVGVKPGAEMKLAAQLAAVNNKQVVLIDQPIAITLKKFGQAITWKEKGRFVYDLIAGVLWNRKKLPFDLRTVPSADLVASLTKEVKDRYPNVYRVLVEERNEIMARRLAQLMQKNPEKKILAVMGAGHAKEVLLLVKEYLK